MYGDQEYAEEAEDQIINEEYKIWKKNSPFLYDLLLSHALEWPSLTVEWFPTQDIPDKSQFKVQKLLIGTHTSNNEQNYLMIVKVRLPLPDSSSDVKEDNFFNNKNEFKLDTEIKINHSGEVNKARSMPQKYNIIASKTISGEIHIFDFHKHPSRPNDNIVKPDIRLQGHNKEGFGLSWNVNKEGFLLSGSDDYKTCLWDIQGKGVAGVMQPLRVFEEHKGVVEDVAWSRHNENIFGSVGDDKNMIIYDLRSDKPSYTIEAHSQEVNSIDFNYFNNNLILSGSNDKTIALWDMRNLSHKLHTFDSHKNEVISARWNPRIETLFASSSADRRINVWDLGQISAKQSAVDAEDGPPELLFIHGGHTSKISDIGWNPNENLMLASVSEDNIVHVWEMANNIYFKEEEEEEENMNVDS